MKPKRRTPRLTKFLLLVLASIYLPTLAHATFSLPPDRSVDWKSAYIGVKGDIPSRTTIHATLSPSGGDDTSAIQSALSGCPAGQVVYLNAGTFHISSNINIPSNVTLRGAGKGNTTIAGNPGMTSSSLISFKAGGGYGSTSYTSAAALSKGQTVVTLNASPGWTVGSLVLIDSANTSITATTVSNVGADGTCTWCGRSSGSRSSGQVNRVAAISGSTVTFETPLMWDFPNTATQFTQINSVTSNAGLENLSVDNQNSGSSSQSSNGGTIIMHNASNCWIQSVDMNGSYMTMLRMMNCYGCTVRQCLLHEGVPAAFTVGGSNYATSRAYGVWIGPGSNCLIEDNQFYHLAMPIKFDEPTSYNVLAYNVITNILYSVNPSWNQAAIEFHGAHPAMNLFESNIVAGRIDADNYWGSSSHNTFFRNRAIIPSGMTGALWDVCLQSNSHNYNFVGNVLGTPRYESIYVLNNVSVPSSAAIYDTGYQSDGDNSATGNDANVYGTLLLHGNWDSVNGATQWLGGADQVLPASLYRSSMPSWWGSAPWPAIGPDVSPMYPADSYPSTPGMANTPFDAGTRGTSSYTIAAGATSGGSITPSGTSSFSAGAGQTYTITPIAGYKISDVTVDSVSVGAVATYSFSSIAANHTITASFAPGSYTITASAGAGGSITPSGAATVAAGGSQSYSITPATGYTIAGVTVDGVSAGAVSSYSFTNVSANHTIQATFAASTYSITASAGTGGSITPSGTATVTAGAGQTYAITPATGYSISYVTVDGVSAGAVSSYSFTNVTANHTIQATFAPITYTVTASAGTGGSITPSGTATVTAGTTQSYSILPAPGYSTAGVSVDGVSVGAVSSYTFSSIAANHTITASFTPITYTITASAGTGGSISPSGTATVSSGAGQSYSIAPASGYQIAGVSVDGVSAGAVASYTFSGVAANHTITASFAPITYTITASAGTGGSITPSGAATVSSGASQSYTIAPASGYKISGVSVDGVSVGAVAGYTFSGIGANHTIQATFTANTTSTGTVVYALDAAGNKYTDAAGVTYVADTNYTGGSTSKTTTTISGTKDQALYQSERYGNFSYKIPVANGNYNVVLKFAECYWSSAGQRIFSVALNGATVIGKLDIFAKVGKNAAYDVVVPVSVTNGVINLNFISQVNNAEVRAIRIEKL